MSRKDQKFTATLIGAERIGASVNGNPTWMLITSEGGFRTKSDASLGYAVSNYTHSRLGWLGREVTFTATPAGRVYAMELAE